MMASAAYSLNPAPTGGGDVPPKTVIGPSALDRIMVVPDSPAKRLKARREQLKLKQSDVAEELGLSRTAYCQYETGSSKLRVDQAEVAARYLKTTPQWLAFGTGDPDPIDEIAYEDGKFVRKSQFWQLGAEWLQRNFGLSPDQTAVYVTDHGGGSLRPGDAAIIDRSSRPGPTVAEYVFALDGEVAIAPLTRLSKTGQIRIHAATRVHQDVSGDEVEVLGRVVGKAGRV